MLIRLGAYKLLHEDPDSMWRFMRRWMHSVISALAPNAGYGVERMPETGPVVLAVNHFSGIDPPAVGIYSSRTVRYMTKVELLEIPVWGELLRMTGCFAVRRGEGDRDALRVARWNLEHGHVVGVFIEGTRQKTGHPGPAQAGAALLAIQEGVPVVPAAIDSFGWSPRNRRPCATVFGEPVDLSGFPRRGTGYKQGTAILQEEILRLWRQAAQAVADGFPAELPDGTKRARAFRSREAIYDGGPSWPTEEWARGPLGPVYQARR